MDSDESDDDDDYWVNIVLLLWDAVNSVFMLKCFRDGTDSFQPSAGCLEAVSLLYMQHWWWVCSHVLSQHSWGDFSSDMSVTVYAVASRVSLFASLHSLFQCCWCTTCVSRCSDTVLEYLCLTTLYCGLLLMCYCPSTMQHFALHFMWMIAWPAQS